MRDHAVATAALLATMTVAGTLGLAGAAQAQSGKIVCWKNSAGKVIGCGDKVPPEFQSSATKELDSRGVVRGTTESAEETAQRRAREQEAARVRAEQERQLVDQKRRDTALLETFSNEREIDLKRDRDLQVIDLQIEQLKTSLKSAASRHEDAKKRLDTLEQAKKPIGAPLREDVARATADKERFEQNIEAKQREKEELRQRYAEYKKRYLELRGAASAQAPVAKR